MEDIGAIIGVASLGAFAAAIVVWTLHERASSRWDEKRRELQDAVLNQMQRAASSTESSEKWSKTAQHFQTVAEQRRKEIDELIAARDGIRAQADRLSADLITATHERERLKTDYNAVFDGRESLQSAYGILMEDHARLSDKHNVLSIERDRWKHLAEDREQGIAAVVRQSEEVARRANVEAEARVNSLEARLDSWARLAGTRLEELDEVKARLAHLVSHRDAWAREGA